MNDRIVGLLSPRPMVVVTSVFIIGILIERSFQVSLGMILITLITISTTLFIFKSIYKNAVLLLLILVSGGLRLATYEFTTNCSLAYFPACHDSTYQVTASVEQIGETRRGTPKYTLKPIMIDHQPISHGKLILYARDLVIIPEIGDTLVAPMLLNQPRSQRNPNDFDYRAYLARQEIYFEGFIESSGQLIIHESSSINTTQIMLSLRDMIKYHFLKDLTPRSSGIMSALILGERSDVDDETKTNFANTGVIHVLAVSGLHVGYVSLILATMIGMLRLPHRLQTVLVIFGLGFYVVLTGGAASVMRASIMAGLILTANLFERKTDIFNILATAAMIILLIDPTQLGGIGFQLSFSAVLSIVMLFPILRDWVPKWSSEHKYFTSFVNGVVDLFLVSLAAQLGTLALTIYYFNKIPIISLGANIIVVPLIGLIVATGLSSLIVGSVFPLVSGLWAALLDGAIDFMLWFVQLCARFEWAFINTRSIQLYEVMLIFFAVFAITFTKRSRLPLIWFILFLGWGNILVWSDLYLSPRLEFVVLDVGQGDALVIHTPNGKTMVIDAGLKFGGKDMGKDVISPFLIDRNWKTIDLLVITHPHNDHIGGAHYLITHHAVKSVLMQDVKYDSYGYRKLQSTLNSMNIPTNSVCTGVIDSSLAPLYLRVIGPKQFEETTQPHNVNNVSIVMQLFYGETTLLLTGDAEVEVERDLLPFGSLLKCDLIKAPHHGSKTSSSPQYIGLIEPQVCLISVGTRNKYKHPAPITLRNFADSGAKVRRTDLEGAIIYHSDGQSWQHHNWKAE
ncbi:MAG: DNA internalization-related competence protein ComEC/Rec2 [Candidatus Marinimicrobia bacterium]|nr:DNA internalization-related competence protein ComEC/Rec2 [Candidatus Neomarinimicrobiota bacterium]